jgi:hypothetical protein
MRGLGAPVSSFKGYAGRVGRRASMSPYTQQQAGRSPVSKCSIRNHPDRTPAPDGICHDQRSSLSLFVRRKPKKPKRIRLTEKEEATLRAIEELGETADVGEIQKKANEILKTMQRRKLN